MGHRSSTCQLARVGKAGRSHHSSIVLRTKLAIRKAVEFLCLTVGDNGAWSDFPTNSSGVSTSWVTAHVLWNAGRVLPEGIATRALRALISEKQASGGWGFSASTPPDADSTAHALAAIVTTGGNVSMHEDSAKFLLSHQKDDGGYATYLSKTQLARYRKRTSETDYTGWVQSHVCVTATVLEALTALGRTDGADVGRAVRFLRQRQSPCGFWTSYWWHSRYFATSHILSALWKIDMEDCGSLVTSALRYICNTQNPNGYWPDHAQTGAPCVLSTAWCVRGMGRIAKYFSAVKKGASWLLSMQCDDGSWLSAPSLRIPPPHIRLPEHYGDWRVGRRGVGAIANDERHIYTTAAVVAALYETVKEE
ncbi:MAG: prenyltransferase/squalene oxidase repeat-containing protein [bacterium]|nr:prenyltransferase/squalene oxidase repeat-containing protein [bacterium]